MQKSLYGYISVCLLFMLSAQVFVQLSLSSGFRAGNGFSHGYKTLEAPGDDLSTFIRQRTRLNLFHLNDDVEARLSLQDIWFGEVSNIGSGS